MLLRELADDAQVQVDPAVRPGIAGRADDHRHAKLARRDEHELEVVRLPRKRARRRVGAEGNGPDVIAPGVRGDAIGTRSDAEAEALFARGREAQVPVRADDAHRLHDGSR
jgi:hypothetical protein